MLTAADTIILGISFVFLTYSLFKHLPTTIFWRVPEGLRLPPGPRGKPLIGNLADIPTYHEWETVTQWAADYGDLVFLNVLGNPMVFVNSLETAREMFEKRSSLYSDRHSLPMMMMMGWDYNVAFMRYGQRWRRQRRTFHQYFNQQATMAHQPIQVKHTRALLQRICYAPEDFVAHLKHLTASIIMEVVYGIKVSPEGDRYIDIAHKALEGASEAGNPGRFLGNLSHDLVVKYVPGWMPGADFKRKAKDWRGPTVEMLVAPFTAVKNALAAGTAEPSVVASFLTRLSRDGNGSEDEEEVVRDVASGAYAAGAGTSVAALLSFVLAMVLHPAAQRKAQAELDAVIGMNRLPNFGDRSRLPYVNALCTEVQRWRPALPLSLTHAVNQDDVYGEYFIPKGTMVVGNSWKILHDEAIYGPRPEEFEPERFTKIGANTPTAQYGFGRRLCPGRYMADNTLFIVVASTLKVFDIIPARDIKGNEIPVTTVYTSGGLSQPEPFQCSIKPRSALAKNLILEEFDTPNGMN